MPKIEKAYRRDALREKSRKGMQFHGKRKIESIINAITKRSKKGTT